VGESYYHVELRHFPRNVCRFNLNAQELRAAVLEPWLADRLFELGELRWDPRHARLTVLEGPRLEPAQLTMGRGWRTAERLSQDVTERLLAATRVESGLGEGEGRVPAAAGGTDGGDLAADSLGLELLAQIGPDQAPLRRAWELAATRDPKATASEALALAERAVASLLRARLVVLLRAEPPETSPAATGPPASGPSASVGQSGGSATAPRPVGEEDTATVLRALDSWNGGRSSAQVYLRRA
jgi:hypothetical protein